MRTQALLHSIFGRALGRLRLTVKSLAHSQCNTKKLTPSTPQRRYQKHTLGVIAFDGRHLHERNVIEDNRISIMKKTEFLTLPQPRSPRISFLTSLFIALTSTLPAIVAFQPTNSLPSFRQRAPSAINTALAAGKSSNNGNGTQCNGSMFDKDSALLTARLQRMRMEILEEELFRPPNAGLNPRQVVEAIMHGLLSPYDPLPDSGFRLLLQTASPKWRNAIATSVGGATLTSSSVFNVDSPMGMELVASALGSSMGRPNNQFAILVGEGEDYVLDFSSEPLDFGDGTCWIECRLRDKHSGELLVITGWDLRQREGDENGGAWMVDWIYWQDFRDEFRPGIGREEWLMEV